MENYNNNSTNQLNLIFRNIEVIHSLIKNTINNFENLKTEKSTLNILDIGSSHGRNSILFLDSILSNVIKPKLPNTIIQIYHADIEFNDWIELFSEVNNNHLYKKKYDNLYVYGIGNTYLNQLVPNNTCDIIFSFNTFHWCLTEEGYFENKNSILIMKPSSRLPGVEEYNKERLSNVFKLRSKELSNGGIFICNFIIMEPDNQDSFSGEVVGASIKSVLREMANDDILSHEEVDRMVIPSTFYKKEEVDYAIYIAEQNDLKVMYFEKYYIKWLDNIKSANPKDLNQAYVQSLLSFSSSSIKSHIKGDEFKVDSIYKEFNKRILQHYTLNPDSFNLSFGFNLIIFQKIK